MSSRRTTGDSPDETDLKSTYDGIAQHMIESWDHPDPKIVAWHSNLRRARRLEKARRATESTAVRSKRSRY